MPGHRVGGGADRRIRMDRHGRGTHQLLGQQPVVSVTVGGATELRGPAPRGSSGLSPRRDQVAPGYYAGYTPAHYEHRHPADVVLDEQPGDGLERCNPMDGNSVRGHHVSDPAVELAVMFVQLLMGCLAGRRTRGLRQCVGRLAYEAGNLVERSADVASGGSSVQRVVVRRAQMTQHGMEMLVLPSHGAPQSGSRGRRATIPDTSCLPVGARDGQGQGPLRSNGARLEWRPGPAAARLGLRWS